MQIPGIQGVDTQSTELDKYRIHEEIGNGAFGVIYRATKLSEGQEVAMKIINTSLLRTESDRNSLQSELNAFIYFKDLNYVVKALNRFTYQNYQIIVMEFAPMDLSQIIKTYQKLPFNYIRTIIAQIVEGFCEIHTAGFSHRDVKPQNILINRNGHIRIADFGTIKKLTQDEYDMTVGLEPFARRKSRLSTGRNSNLSTPRTLQAQSFVGTQQYQAPEIQNAKAFYSTPTDIYGIGLIAFELATGVPYFALKDNADKYFEFMNQDLKNFILKCLERNPYSRFQGGWKMLKSFDLFKDVHFDKLEQFQLVNVLDIKKDIMQNFRTNQKLSKQIQICDKKLAVQMQSYKKYLLNYESIIFSIKAEILFEGSKQDSIMLITDFHRLLLINHKSHVYYENFIIIQLLTHSITDKYFYIQLDQDTIKIYTSAKNQKSIQDLFISKFRPFNRTYCSTCKQLTVKDLLCSKCGATVRIRGKKTFFIPTTKNLPSSGDFAADIINQIPEKIIIDTGRLLKAQNGLKINFVPQIMMSKQAISVSLNLMNQLKTQLFFPSISQLERYNLSVPLPKIIALFSQNQTKVSAQIASFYRVLRYSICKYGAFVGFCGVENIEESSKRYIDEEELSVERVDFEVGVEEFQ